MPALLHRTLGRSIPAALFAALLTVSLPSAAFAGPIAESAMPTPSGMLQGMVIAGILLVAAGLAVLAQLERERIHSRGRHLARHRLQPALKVRRAAAVGPRGVQHGMATRIPTA